MGTSVDCEADGAMDEIKEALKELAEDRLSTEDVDNGVHEIDDADM